MPPIDVGRNGMASPDAVADRLRALIDHAPAGMLEFEATADGRLVFAGCNAAAERVVARPLMQLAGLELHRMFPGLASDGVPEGIREVALGGPPREWVGFRYADIHGAGQFDLHVTQVAEGRAVLMFRDVTPASEALLTVRASEAKFSQAFHVNPDPMIITRLRDGVILDANRAFEGFSGHARGTLVGQPVLRVGIWAEPTDRGRFIERLRAHGSVRDFATVQRIASGQIRDVLITSSLFNVGPDTCAMTVVRDVTVARRLDESLRQSEAKFGAAFRGSLDSMTIAHLEDGRIEEANEAFERTFGIPRREAVGRTGAELGLYVSDAQRDAFLGRVRMSGSVRDFPLDLRRRDGETFEALATAFPVDIQGVACVVSVVRDVSEMRRRERELRESEARFSAAFRSSPDAIAITVFGTGRFVDVNDAFCELVGRTRAELAGRTTVEIGSWDDLATRARYLALLESEGKVRDFETNVRHSGGEMRACLVNSTIAELAGERCVLAVIRDVTDRMRTARALARSQHMLELVLESIPVGVFWKDRDHVYRGANRVFAADASVPTPADLIGHTDAELPWSVHAERYMATDDEVMASGRAILGYEELEDVPGRPPRWQLKNKVPLLDADGSVLGVLGTEIDITAKRQAEDALRELNATLERRVAERTHDLALSNTELEAALATLARTQSELVQSEKMAALGALVAGVSHELNTPIGNALMVASTLGARVGQIDAALRQGLTRSSLDQFLRDVGEAETILMRNLQRASELISSFKQVAVDRSSSQRRRFALRDTVGEIVLTLSPTIRRRAIRIDHTDVPDVELDSYPGAIGQVLTNLVNNAVMHAFGSDRGGSIGIRARTVDGDRIEIAVSDDGAGIPPENLHRVFEPFFTTRLGTGGSGLGLSIVHNLVTAVLGGRIEVESTPGHGTTFLITLPRVAPERDEKGRADAG